MVVPIESCVMPAIRLMLTIQILKPREGIEPAMADNGTAGTVAQHIKAYNSRVLRLHKWPVKNNSDPETRLQDSPTSEGKGRWNCFKIESLAVAAQ